MLLNKNLFKKFVFLSFCLFVCLFVAQPVIAAALSNPLESICTIDGEVREGSECIPLLLGGIIRGALGIVGSVALLMFVYGGFLLLTSSGNKDMVQKGKATLVWATIGIAVIFFSYVAVGFIIDALTGVAEEEETEEVSIMENYNPINLQLYES